MYRPKRHTVQVIVYQKIVKKVLDKQVLLLYNIVCFEVWLSLVERFVRDEEAAGSNPVTSINFKGFR